eukprot:m.1489391 g.1489391  ORF g.1489391 m.1489391 type:complete len:308 (-) comp25190_c0_seq3:2736-3659(-)
MYISATSARMFQSTILVAVLVVSVGNAAEIIVVGDSWGTVGKSEFAAMAQLHGLGVDNIAIGGSTAAQWAQSDYLLMIFEALSRNHDARHIWLTIGGNDILYGLAAGIPIDQLLEGAMGNTSTILEHIFDNSNVSVVQFGYDIPNYDVSLSCMNKVAKLALNCNSEWSEVPANGFNDFVRCSNGDNTQLQYGFVDAMVKKADEKKWDYTGLNLLGLFQYFGSVDGADIGKPNMLQYSPAQYWMDDCTHPSQLGFTSLFYVLWEKYFALKDKAIMNVGGLLKAHVEKAHVAVQKPFRVINNSLQLLRQ